MRWVVIAACVGVVLLSAASMTGWAMSYRAGVASVESTGLQLQEIYPQRVMFEVITRMEPARVHLQQGLELLHQLGLDPTTWEAYDAIRAHGVSFLLNYFDDTQCCYAMFTRMGYEPGVNEDNFGDDRALFDGVIASKEIDPVSGESVTALFDIRPEDTGGSRVNNAYWVPYNMTTRRLPENLEVTDYPSLGFSHFPRDDGKEPNNPESGWWNIINNRDMQEGDFCFSPIFVWRLNEPVTLKIHGIMPVFAPAAAPSLPGAAPARERVGAYIVGFKLYFLSKALQNVDHKGGPIFLVEKSTGYIIAANSDVPLMSEDMTAIKVADVSDAAIKEISEYLAPDGSWKDVQPGHKDLINVQGVRSYIFVDELNHYCLEWLIVVGVQRSEVLEQFNQYTLGSIISSFAMPLCLTVFSCLALLGVFVLNRFMKNSKKGNSRGPPKQGDKVTLVTTDIQGSTTLWDTYPEMVARDIALHHQCLRHSLKDFQGYEIATEGDSFKCAFHTSEDAVCWAIQVQFNLLCAPWSEELEDGGQSVLGDGPTWADTSVVRLPEHCEELIWGLAKDVSVFRTDMLKTRSSRSLRPSIDSSKSADQNSANQADMFSPSEAASTPYSACQAVTAPLAVVHHTDGSCLPVFRGLRVRIGMHTGVATDVKVHESTKRMMYGGRVAEVTKAVSDMPCGGQIIMTSETLADIESMHDLMLKVSDQCSAWYSSMSCAVDRIEDPGSSDPAAMSVMHLGSHMILKPPPRSSRGLPSGPQTAPLQNTNSLTSRKLESIVSGVSGNSFSNEIVVDMESTVPQRGSTEGEISSHADDAGSCGGGAVSSAARYRMAQAQELVMVVPWPLRSRALFFPPLPAEKEVAPAWHAAPPGKGVTIVFAFIANWSSLKQWDEGATDKEGVAVVPKALEELNLVVRTILTANCGYEVEGEDGNYVCAFGVPENAIQFAVQIQDALMSVEWDEALLQNPWAAEQRRPDGVLLFRGLRMSVGMCTGDARRVQPSVRTGRQEYYGPIMNHAARLAVAAHGGQVLIHEDTAAAWRGPTGETRGPGEGRGKLPVYLVSLGKHKLKGVSRRIDISELSCPSTASRSFSRIKAIKSLQQLDVGTRRASDYGRSYRGSDGSNSASASRASLLQEQKIETSSVSVSSAAAAVMGSSTSSLPAMVLMGRRPSVSFAAATQQSHDVPTSPPSQALSSIGRRRTDSADSKNCEGRCSSPLRPTKLKERRESL